jgi:aspartyl-tRNA(Asn)/glutamyl-tRNA(Gln) amidotransferase subunit C
MTTDQPSKNNFTMDAEMVRHVAFLVRLGIREEEARAFSNQFTAIIDYFHLLNEVDTSNIPPASETSNTSSVMRADEVSPSMPRQDFMENVPHQHGNYVQVPRVFGEE